MRDRYYTFADLATTVGIASGLVTLFIICVVDYKLFFIVMGCIFSALILGCIIMLILAQCMKIYLDYKDEKRRNKNDY